jgi:hypothetical protein
MLQRRDFVSPDSYHVKVTLPRAFFGSNFGGRM